MTFNIKNYFTKTEKLLWSMSVATIILSFVIFDRSNYFTLTASVIGVTSLIFCAKGNPIGQVLMIIFASLYAFISYHFHYYGEMITYMGMSLPMSVISLVSWLRNPYNAGGSEVKVNKINQKEFVFLIFLTIIVTSNFYYILKALRTANLYVSTASIATSFMAAYLTFRRSEYFALMYAVNDIVLICMWILATLNDISYIGVIICFAVFLFNDLYSFFNWQKMKKRQNDSQ